MTDSTTSTPQDLRILVVTDDPLARAGLATLVGGPDSGIDGEFVNSEDVESVVSARQPDAVLWDLGADPSVLAERVASLEDISRPVIALVPDETHVGEVLARGTRGVLLRDTESSALVCALRAVAQGLMVLDPSLANALLPAYVHGSERLTEDLTTRENEVLKHLAAGLSNKLIAKRLGISEHTVKFHVNAILGKLGVQSRTEAVVRAARLGLVML